VSGPAKIGVFRVVLKIEIINPVRSIKVRGKDFYVSQLETHPGFLRLGRQFLTRARFRIR
jgi:hypothetical protein